MQLIETPRPKRVVDIGCGTGLSTRIWLGRADRIIGIEPNADMRTAAQHRKENDDTIEYREGTSSKTGLEDGCADIVTISQALHWMEPTPTFAEVARILRTGGIFAAYDCDWPPIVTAELSAVYQVFDHAARRLTKTRNISPRVKHHNKDEHLGRVRASGFFHPTNELVMHSIETGDADRLVNLAISQGDVQSALKSGVTEDELGIPEFRRTVQRIFAGRTMRWYFSYRVRVGVKGKISA
jgi:ubiquinone/menaquinone biosynthesis C-methylase UbiE